MATNLKVGKYKNIDERTSVAPSLNFVPSSRNKHAVAKCGAQLGLVGNCREVFWKRGRGGRKGEGPVGNASFVFAAFCDSQKSLEKMAKQSHPCLKPGLHNRYHYFPSPCLACLALALNVLPERFWKFRILPIRHLEKFKLLPARFQDWRHNFVIFKLR